LAIYIIQHNIKFTKLKNSPNSPNFDSPDITIYPLLERVSYNLILSYSIEWVSRILNLHIIDVSLISVWIMAHRSIHKLITSLNYDRH